MQSYLSTMIVIGQKNGFLDRGLILIVVLSAIVPSLQDIGSNTHPDLPICGHVSPFFYAACCFGRGDVGGGLSAGRNLPGI